MSILSWLKKPQVAKGTGEPTPESLIQYWRGIYRGSPAWLDYEYPTLSGRVHKRTRKTMRPAKLVCGELSSLIWGEWPNMNAGATMQEILEASAFSQNMPRFTEKVMALGGGALKVYIENRMPKLDYVPADRFIPVSWDARQVTEADFLDRRVIKNKEYLRVEKHRLRREGGQVVAVDIYNEAYRVDGQTLKPVSLSEMGIEVDSLQSVEVTRPLFQYIRNPEANNLIDDTPIGISVFANAADTIESLDIAFDALQSEIVLGRKRIIVPASAVRHVMDAETGKPQRYFDPSDEVYQAFSGDDKDQLKITDTSVELRINEIRQAIQTLLDILSVQVGFSSGYLSFDGESVKTATEVIAENSRTYKTKQFWEKPLGGAVQEILEVLREIGVMYGYRFEHSDDYIVGWHDGVIESRDSRTDHWLKRFKAGTATLEDVLQRLDNLDEAGANEKAQAIRDAQATVDVGGIWGAE